MDIASLIPMVGDGPNLPLIKSIGESSPALDLLQENFHPALGDQGQAEIICFYETAESPTAQQVLRTIVLSNVAWDVDSRFKQDKEGRWRMNGPPTVLVTKASAVHCRSWELDDIHVCPIARSHSEIVKFSPADSLYNDVQDRLLGLAQRAIGIQQRI